MATHAALKKQFSRLCSDKKNDQKEALLLIKNHLIARLDKIKEASLQVVAKTLAEGDAAASLLGLLDDEDEVIQENSQSVMWFITGCFEAVSVTVGPMGRARGTAALPWLGLC
jgi:hypothetical protein